MLRMEGVFLLRKSGLLRIGGESQHPTDAQGRKRGVSDHPEYESSCSILESTQSKSPRVILAPQWPHSPAMLT
jgi:hypothetical protein